MFRLLLCLLCLYVELFKSCEARQDRTAVDFSTGGIEALTAGATAGYMVATTEAPKTTTEYTAVSRKQTAAAAAEGPLELGAWILFYEFGLFVFCPVWKTTFSHQKDWTETFSVP